VDEANETIGTRIRRCRRLRGLSLDEAAGLAGISKPYLSRLERGLRSVDSRALLARLAAVLDVSVTELTGQPYTPRDPQHAAAHRGVAGVRLALLDPDGPSPFDALTGNSDAAELLEQRAADLWSLSRDSDMVTQARVTPALLLSAHKYVTEHPSAAAHRAVALAAYDASFFVRNLGEPDLAWIAAQRMQQACEEINDPAWLAFAAYAQAHALTQVGALARASTVAATAAQATPTPDARVEQIAARGSCLLVASFAASCVGEADVARAQLDEAEVLAGRLARQNVVANNTSFSEWNVIMHRVAVEVEADNPSAALEAAEQLNPTDVSHRERMSYLWVDVGRAWARLDRPREAIGAFRRAERAAPLRVRLSPVVRESVRDLLDSIRRGSTGAELRGLAERCGVLTV
jgi:transcriptional regulator with XRE-family HTH domain